MLQKDHIATFQVRIGDINYGGHMGNDKALLLFHDARISFLESIGYEEKNIGNETGIILTEAHVYYLKEIFAYDQLYANVAVTDYSSASFTLQYTIIRDGDGREVLKGNTRLLAYDYSKHKVVRLPEEFRKVILGEGDVL